MNNGYFCKLIFYRYSYKSDFTVYRRRYFLRLTLGKVNETNHAGVFLSPWSYKNLNIYIYMQ